MNDLFIKTVSGKLECRVCPHFCKVGKGKTGICGVRRNTGEKIELLTYGVVSGYSLDPVEKKPLYHFFPGMNILSIGSYGCNMKCDFCQNYHISQSLPARFTKNIDPDDIVRNSLSARNNIGVAYTYNEPAIWFEFVRDVALLVRKSGQRNVMVTNGYMSEESLSEYLCFIDAFNVDLKAFNADFYRMISHASLEPVKESLMQIRKAGKHLEITTLVIADVNDRVDEFEMQVRWIADVLGKETPFHLSRYFPMFRRNNPPTPLRTLEKFYDIAAKYLQYIYIGNISTGKGQDTLCPGYGITVTKRSGYYTINTNTENGSCTKCGREIYRYFTSSSPTGN